MKQLGVGKRTLSILAFSFLFAYILSFLFEGRVLYSVLDAGAADTSRFVFPAIIAHFFGQRTCRFFCRSSQSAKRVMLGGMAICLPATATFFLADSTVWTAALIIGGYAAGCAVAAWGCFLKECTPQNERIKTCADVLIYSNLMMIAVNIVTINVSAEFGLALSMLCLVAGMIFTGMLPTNGPATWTADTEKPAPGIGKPMGVLFLFVAVITVNSGLMYQVINPAFAHLTVLTSWYWAVPYVAALIVMRNLPMRINRTVFLYMGMGMIMCAFLAFMLLGRGAADYLIVDTLMLGACGIFDLFWWSIIGEMLEYSGSPVSVFGIGLSANVCGVLCGDMVGAAVTAATLPDAQVTVIALCVVCVTLILLPPLNRELTRLLKNHAYLSAYAALPENARRSAAASVTPLDPLTEREGEILRLALSGKSNREIAADSFIAESTVKTHLRSIYSKYAVSSRAELISLLLGSRDC